MSFYEIRLKLMRAGLFAVVYTVILGVPFWLAIRTSRHLMALALMGVLASIGPFIFGMLGKKVTDILLAQQRRYQQILLQFSQSLVKEHDLDLLSKFIVYTIKRTVNIELAALFLNDPVNEAYTLKASRNAAKIQPKFRFTYQHPLVDYLKEHKRPLLIECLPGPLQGFNDIDLGVRLIVPSFSDDKLAGFIFLGAKLDGTPYSADDINVFETLSNQAALAIGNCIYLREFEKAREKVFNAEKLASIGGMADGVAHQIKNRLNHFSIGAGEQQCEIEDFKKKYSKLVGANPELNKTLDYLHEIAGSMLENVRKTSNVIQGVLGFAQEEQRGAICGEFQLDEIIRPGIALLCVRHQINEFPLEIAESGAMTISGVKSQLMECFYNIFDNAYEAITEKMDFHLPEKHGFLPKISLKILKTERSKILEISDNGVGVKKENLNKIFDPFFTTKSSSKASSSVGMYVVKRMVEQHNNGRIWVESEYLKGTRVFIELPDDGKSL